MDSAPVSISRRTFAPLAGNFHAGKNSSCCIATDNSGREFIIKKITLPGTDHTSFLDKLSGFFELTNSIQGVCKTEAFEISGNSLLIARPYIHGNSMKAVARSLKKKQSIHITIALLKVIGQLHKKGILHCDIKPSNVIIPPDRKASPVLIDLELAMWNHEFVIPSAKLPYSLIYSPPEQILRRKQLMGTHSDLFCCGIILYELLAKRPAFRHANPELLMNLQLAYPLKKPLFMNKQLFAVIEKSTQRHPFPTSLRRMDEQSKLAILQKSINSRYKNAYDFIDDLSVFL